MSTIVKAKHVFKEFQLSVTCIENITLSDTRRKELDLVKFYKWRVYLFLQRKRVCRKIAKLSEVETNYESNIRQLTSN